MQALVRFMKQWVTYLDLAVKSSRERYRRWTTKCSSLLLMMSPSVRAAMNPCDGEAGVCLRILGSFASEAEATTRVLNLYHSVLPANVSSVGFFLCVTD